MQLVLGASLTLAFAPFNIWWLVFVIFPVWFYYVHISNLSAFKLSFWFSIGYFGAGLSWVHVSIADFGGLPLLGSLGLMLLLSAYLALYPSAVMAILKKYINIYAWPIALPLLWLLSEWLRARVLTGFPWLSIGYSQLEGPLAGLFPIIGEIGVSAMVVCVCASFALAIANKNLMVPAGLAATVLITSVVLNSFSWTTQTGLTKSVTMVQGNIPQTLRWAPDQDSPTMQKYLRMTEEHWENDIIIWPEAAIPKLEPLAVEFLERLDKHATETDTALITGIVNYHFEAEQVFNNLIALGLDSANENTVPYRYMHSNRFDKHHLLPIGEFVPLEGFLRNIAPIFDLPMSSFTRGDYVQRNLHVKGLYLAPAICFEIAFPRQILANLTTQTHAIITVSNDAWFGDSHGPHQHLQIAQVRAKEFGLPVLRSTNNGVTAFIDHRGQISQQAEQFEDVTLTHQVALVEGKTAYRMLGDYPIWMFFIILNLAAYFANFYRKSNIR